MYEPLELARFALSEFQRGLEGLTEKEARTQVKKADGTKMNSISWIVGHIAGHWLNRPNRLKQFAPESDDTKPPPLSDVLKLLDEANEWTERWITSANDVLMSAIPSGAGPGAESKGTGLMRTILHTWFHLGEINAIRQMLGHPEIAFVGTMAGTVEWRGRR